jgi:hypothetical protein
MGLFFCDRSELLFQFAVLECLDGGFHRSGRSKEDSHPCPLEQSSRFPPDVPRDDAIHVFSGYDMPGSRPAGDSMHPGGIFF